MGFRRSEEGWATYVFSLSSLRDTIYAQNSILESGIKFADDNRLEAQLSTVAAVLGFFVTKAPTPVSVALSAISLAASLSLNQREDIMYLGNAGLQFLTSVREFMEEHPDYDLIELKYPYITFFDVNDDGEDITLVSGRGLITKLHVKGGTGWIPADIGF